MKNYFFSEKQVEYVDLYESVLNKKNDYARRMHKIEFLSSIKNSF